MTRAQYDALVEAYREVPGNFSRAGRAAGCDLRTARRAWRNGWDSPPWARSIRELFEEEQAVVRAAMYEEDAARQKKAADARETRQKAEFDAVEEKKREAQAVRAAMSSSMSALAVSGQLAKARLELSQKTAEQIVAAAQAGSITWQAAIPLLVKLQWLDSQAVGQLRTSMDILRVHIGEADKFIPNSGIDPKRLAEVDGSSAAEALGGDENLKQAVVDLAEGRMTPLVERLIEYQLESRTGTPS